MILCGLKIELWYIFTSININKVIDCLGNP